MSDYLLKAASREVMNSKLFELGLLREVLDDEGGTIRITASRVSITGYGGAAIPTIWTTKPTYNEDGSTDVVGVEHADYHCNVRDMANIVPEFILDEDGEQVSPWGDVTVIDPATIKTPAMAWG